MRSACFWSNTTEKKFLKIKMLKIKFRKSKKHVLFDESVKKCDEI